MSEKATTPEKETIRLPDGRRLIYYRFPDVPAPPAPASPPAAREDA
jgi:hypothetical protein